MNRYKKILFPIDLTEGSEEIAKHVKAIADKFGAEIHIIFIAHVRHYYDGLYIGASYVGDFEHEVVKAAERQFQDFTNENFHDYSAITKVITGYPGDEILCYAKSEKIDLIIMGHSRKGIKRLILGSVAGHVVKRSQAPVMIVNPYDVEEENGIQK